MVRRKNMVLEPEETTGREVQTCRHYWVIDSPQGPTSRGVCKFCGAVKEFYNSWSALASVWSRSSPAHSPRSKPAADIEPADNSEHEAAEPDVDTDFRDEWESESQNQSQDRLPGGDLT